MSTPTSVCEGVSVTVGDGRREVVARPFQAQERRTVTDVGCGDWP
jgi:hypothetical protein